MRSFLNLENIRDCMIKEDILEITKGLANETYFDEERRIGFIKELDFMIDSHLESWNKLLGSYELVNFLGEEINFEKIEFDERLKNELRKNYKVSEELINNLEKFRPLITKGINSLLNIRDHVKKGGFFSIKETKDNYSRLNCEILRYLTQINDISLIYFEKLGLWEDLRVISGVIKSDKVSLKYIKESQKL